MGNVVMSMRDIVSLNELSVRERYLFGVKASNLGTALAMGIAVPPGFVLSTNLCRRILDDPDYLDAVWGKVVDSIRSLESEAEAKFNDVSNPLLVSVRTSPPETMPGILSTVLNVGITSKNLHWFRSAYGNDLTWQLFIKFLLTLVHSLPGDMREELVQVLRDYTSLEGCDDIKTPLPKRMKSTIERLRRAFRQFELEGIFDDAYEQLRVSILAALRSWMFPEATRYRTERGLEHKACAAVMVMRMVLGNRDQDSLSGVVFSRDPNSGERKIVGDFAISCQCDEVVQGRAVSQPIGDLSKRVPGVYKRLVDVVDRLEKRLGHPVDIEFTVESGKLWILQVRAVEMTPQASVRSLYSLYREGVVDTKELIARIDPSSLRRLAFPRVRAEDRQVALNEGRLVAVGMGVSPGVGAGPLRFVRPLERIEPDDVSGMIVVFDELKPADVERVRLSEGLIVARGGTTSHSVIIARSMGKPAVILGPSKGVVVDTISQKLHFSECSVRADDVVTIDGLSGEVFVGRLEKETAKIPREMYEIAAIARNCSDRIGVRANVESPHELKEVIAWGIDRINARTEIREAIREYVLAEDEGERRQALSALFGMQREFFLRFIGELRTGIVTFKLIDPPLHEFLPDPEHALRDYYEARSEGRDTHKLERLLRKVSEHSSRNPMLGLRGTRLAVVHPELYAVQVRSLLSALDGSGKNTNSNPVVRILIPDVINSAEVDYVRRIIEQEIVRYEQENGTRYRIPIGVVIETPAAVVNMDGIARLSDFLVIGTNDLTQLFLGMGREDSEKFFLDKYVDLGILPQNPFRSLENTVVEFLESAIRKLRRQRPQFEIGLAGEQSIDCESIKKCIRAGIDYMSVTGKMVPVGIVLAAKASLGLECSRSGK